MEVAEILGIGIYDLEGERARGGEWEKKNIK
jgi:hypothetical protein